MFSRIMASFYQHHFKELLVKMFWQTVNYIGYIRMWKTGTFFKEPMATHPCIEIDIYNCIIIMTRNKDLDLRLHT